MEGVYLIHTRECISTNKFIYKFGRSLNISNRIKQYPQNSNVEFMMSCNNSIFCEKEILKLLRAKFIQASLYGSEYFEGDKHLMIEIIVNYINGKHNIVEGKKKIDIKNCNKKIKDMKIVVEKVNNVIVDNVNTIQSLLENNTEIKSNEYISDRKCPKCKVFFKYPSVLKVHMTKTVHCLMSNEEILNHFNMVNNQNNNIIECKFCKNTFTRNSDLTRHCLKSKCGKLQNLKNKET